MDFKGFIKKSIRNISLACLGFFITLYFIIMITCLFDDRLTFGISMLIFALFCRFLIYNSGNNKSVMLVILDGISIFFRLLLVFILFIVSVYCFIIIKDCFNDVYNFRYVSLILFTFIIFLPVFILLFFKFKYKKNVVIFFFALNSIILVIFCLYNYYTFGSLGLYKIQSIDNTYSNIDVNDYLPFVEDSKIARLDKGASVKIVGDLPRVDGAAAVFPLYSAFVNALYPENVKLDMEEFQYNNTVIGYEKLAKRETDIFFGAYPSKEQIKYAEKNGVEFLCTPIGKEGFVFFVNKDNPVNNLNKKQIRDIYAGKITSWNKVGGKFSRIIPFQRNEGSGSQSMLERFMEGQKLMSPPISIINDGMMGIIKQVSNYSNYRNAIGFSFRYYAEDLVKNDNIKFLRIDGVEPTRKNISNDKYPINTKLYAITRKGEHTPNVDKMLNWILSNEGQELVYKTGYAKLNK